MKRFLAKHSPLVIFAVLCIVLAFLSENFGSASNLQSVSMRTCVVSIVAVGQVLVIISGGIDLSVGSVAALGGIMAAWVMNSACWGGAGVHPLSQTIAGVLAGAGAGMLCGLLNGLLVTAGRIPPFIATLGMMMAARGVALLVAGGSPIYNSPVPYRYLGGTRGWWIPVVIAGGIMLVFAIALATTRFGRHLFATGGNALSARLSGIRVDRVRLAAYSLCGLLAGFAGCVLASRTGIADPTAAEGMELDAIAACVIGGASLMGGEGGAIGTVAGALIMNVLVNYCNLENIDSYWQKVLIGVLIVALVCYDTYRKRRAGLLRDE